MKCPTVDAPQLESPFARHLFEEAAGPSPIVDVRTRCNEGQLFATLWRGPWLKARNPSRESPELYCVFLGGEISATSPRLVAHTPEAHVEWFFESSIRAHIG